MKDPLLEATEALRGFGKPGSPSAVTRVRVLASLEKTERRSTRRVVLVMPLAALLIGSVAFAATGGRLPAPLQDWLAAHTTRAVRQTNQSARVATQNQKPQSTRAAQSVSDAGVPDRPNGVANDNAEQREVHDSQRVESTSTAEKAARSANRVSLGREHSVIDDKPISEEEYERYRTAHNAHFVQKDPTAALQAWSEYLAQTPSGRLAVEARYNRALCLLRLGRNQEAIAALQPFTDGTYGAYRQRDAQRLLARLHGDAGQF
jgi:TolA-binding protein